MQAQPECRILIVNHENISNNCYRGNAQEMLVPLCLFRMGGGAALLSNKYAPLLQYQYPPPPPKKKGKQDAQSSVSDQGIEPLLARSKLSTYSSSCPLTWLCSPKTELLINE
jgi:hypothetical protein